jgi:hypothetical protein
LVNEFKKRHGRGELKNLRRYEKCAMKIERLNNSMKFLILCKKEYITRKFFRLNVPFYQNRRSPRILENASRMLLIERISELRRERNM